VPSQRRQIYIKIFNPKVPLEIAMYDAMYGGPPKAMMTIKVVPLKAPENY